MDPNHPQSFMNLLTGDNSQRNLANNVNIVPNLLIGNTIHNTLNNTHICNILNYHQTFPFKARMSPNSKFQLRFNTPSLSATPT